LFLWLYLEKLVGTTFFFSKSKKHHFQAEKVLKNF
jgi:hypothetical protein